jgi:hypothetical protein
MESIRRGSPSSGGSRARVVSVIVPVRDDGDGVRELLARLQAQTVPPDTFEVLIGDDGSRPGSLSGVETPDGRIRVLSGPPRTSYAARNRAVRASSGSILAFCDADCRPDAAWLEQGLAALDGADVAAGEVIFAPPVIPTAWSLLTIDMFLDQQRNVRFSRAVTANLFVRRSVFDSVEGFDESLASGGDYDFTRRAVSRGAKLVYAPAAVVRHPTIDRSRAFLRKVWFTNRWHGVRSARAGVRPRLQDLVEFMPVIGVALARHRALRSATQLSRARLAAAGVRAGWSEDLRTIPLIYAGIAYVAAAAQARGWLDGRRAAPARVGRRPSEALPAREPGPGPRSRSVALRVGRPGGCDLPNLVIVGAQKCGTSSLHYYLGLHPEISMSRRKELNFFIEERNWRLGVDWYRRRFEAGAPVRGESSPNYAAFPRFDGVPARMAALIPDARLIYLVRDPIERIASHWVHNYAMRRDRGDLRTTLLYPRSTYVARSCYHAQLQRFLEHFDRSRILVLDSRDLRDRRLHTLRRVFEFLGVNPEFYHQGFEYVRHSSEEKRRATRVGLQVRRLSRTSPGLVVPLPVWRAVEAGFGLTRPFEARPDVRQALGEAVVERLRADAERLRADTGLALDHWSIFDSARPAAQGPA